MKKILLLTGITVLVFTTACNNESKNEDVHKHEDGTEHAHADTVKPAQQEFVVTDSLRTDSLKKDTSAHSHEGGEKHSH